MKRYILTGIKYLSALAFIILGCNTVHNFKYFIFSLLELVAIILVTNSLKMANRHLQILGNILVLLFNAQNLVLWFGNSYISIMMLENLSSIKDLQGRAFTYGFGVLAVIIVSFLPVEIFEINNKKKLMQIGTVAVLIADIILASSIGAGFTPASGYSNLFSQYKTNIEMRKMVEAYKSSEIAYYSEENTPLGSTISENMSQSSSLDFFTSDEIADDEILNGLNSEEVAVLSATEDADLVAASAEISSGNNIIGSNNNMILIFTEGLSENVITDNRGIANNMRAFSNQSIRFVNYYNHTFATYRAIQGQLHSGVLVDDQGIINYPSMVDVMKAAGYYTVIINTEPANAQWVNYLHHLDFDEVYTPATNLEFVRDSDSYDELYNLAQKFNSENRKFFIVIYTIGTHASFDSTDQLFGDGLNSELNKFYDCDYQFGKFFNKFLNSSLVNNTAIALTTDHATYADELFVSAFPTYGRACSDCDRIPFYVYYKGLSMTVDAANRNSMDLAPTLLDMLGLNIPATFMGRSLFLSKNQTYAADTIFWDPYTMLYTGSGSLTPLMNCEGGAELYNTWINNITRYSALSTQ